MLTVVHDADWSNDATGDSAGRSLLDEIVRGGARQMLAAALQAEVAAYIDAHVGEVDDAGHRLVVRNGYHDEGSRAAGISMAYKLIEACPVSVAGGQRATPGRTGPSRRQIQQRQTRRTARRDRHRGGGVEPVIHGLTIARVC